MEFNFEETECDDYHKIQIKKDFILFYADKTFKAFPRQKTVINMDYYYHGDYCTKKECNSVIITFSNNEKVVEFEFKSPNRKRMNSFMDFIISITNDLSNNQANKIADLSNEAKNIVNKIDDIFNFLIGQKRFEENKDSL